MFFVAKNAICVKIKSMLSDEYFYLKIGRAADLRRLGKKGEAVLYRLFEILPGFLTWLTFASVVSFSWLSPIFTAFFIILFDLYWLLKTVYLSLHLRVAFKRVKENLKINWLKELEILPPEKYTSDAKNWKEFYHLIILPFYDEGFEVISSCLESLGKANYPPEKMIVVLGAEERAGANVLLTAQKAQEKFGGKFFRFLITVHPKDIEGEIAGKGSNIAWAGRKVKEQIIDALGIPYNRVIVSAFDIDTVVFPDYFSRLTYVYLKTKNPKRRSYQPIPFYVNNIWQAPAFARVVSFSATFWHTLQQERAERLTTFSSHSMPFQALVDVDFWQANMVSEDSRIFWQCLLRYDGNYGVVPLHYPVAMDANVAPSFWQTMKNQYKQQRRWAYGAENIPYFLFGFWKNEKMGIGKKLYYSFVYIEGVWSWSTNALLIFLLGWLPLVLGGEAFNTMILAYNLPKITRNLMMLASFGIITSAYLSIVILPPRPAHYGKRKYLWMILQWPLLFLTMIFFGAFPAIDAQTRLMFGKYIGFWVTPKFRK